MFKNKKILIGISGGIAVYKICSLVNLIKKEGGIPRVIMTDAAKKFVPELTFQSLTGYPVHTDLFDIVNKSDVEHIVLADWCDVLLLAPTTYNTINKIKNGIADNLLTTVVAALKKNIPVLLAPAMNCHMWENEILQNNITFLKSIKIDDKRYKYTFIDPEEGDLVCGYKGKGKIPDNQSILKKLDSLLK